MNPRMRCMGLILALCLAQACSDDTAAPTVALGSANGGGTGGSVDGLVLADGAVVKPDGAGAELAVVTDVADGGPVFLEVTLPETVLPPPDSDAAPSDLDAATTDLADDGDTAPTDGATLDGSESGDEDKDAPLADGDATVADADVANPGDTVLQGCESAKDCPAGWQCVKTPVGKICAEPACVPKSFELCNGEDDDCNGDVDEGTLCNDGNTCTTDSCGGKLGCKVVLAPLGVLCDLDGTPCTADVCAAGQCAAGPPKDCSDGNPCTIDSCLAGACQHKPQGLTVCDDGNPCTATDKCTAGVCQPGAPVPCNDGNPCTDDVCFPSTGKCLSANAQTGIPCNDGNLCTTADTCALGACSGKPANCEDGNPCTASTCDPKGGCVHSPLDGAPCNDNNACTSADVCKKGVCGGGQLACDDANPCTLDGCAAGGGCTHTAIVGACSDGSVCTTGEKCGPDGCKGGTVQICNDGNPCTNDTCDPQKGCAYVANNGPCNDGKACTLNEVCQGGSCAASKLLDCNDNVACTADVCDGALGGCLHTPKVEACDDGDICTVDQCLTATGCKHTTIEKCCGGKQCAPTEVCIQYPDTLMPFCAKPCQSGADCPTSCCHMTFKTKHCLVAPYLDQCCGTPEYWPTDPNPYGCGVGGKGKCVNYPNPQPPYYPSKITYCTTPCTQNSDCPGSCCGLTTMGSQQCVNPAYKATLCPKM